MKLTLLGSGAAEAFPGLWCTCETCRTAWERGGPDIRRRTCYLVNDNLLVDFGPDIHWQIHAFGVDLTKIAGVILTHSHEDHWNTVDFARRQPGFSVVDERITLHANQHVFDRLKKDMGFVPDQILVDGHRIGPGDRFETAGLQVTALEASHAGRDEQALNYVLRDDRVGLLIANDTGWWSDATWDLIAGQQLDAAVIECTYGLGMPDQRNGHLGAHAAIDFRDRLFDLDALRPDAQVLVNHFTHNSHSLHSELCEFFEPQGIAVGYDGLVVDV